MENWLLPIETLFLIHRDMQQQNQNYSKQIVLKLLGSRTVEPRTPKKGGTQVPYIILTFKRTFKGLTPALLKRVSGVTKTSPFLFWSSLKWTGSVWLQIDFSCRGGLQLLKPPGEPQSSCKCSHHSRGVVSSTHQSTAVIGLFCFVVAVASHGCWPKPWWGPWICPRAALPVTVTAQAMQVECVQKGTNRFQTTVPSNTERSPSSSQNHSFLGSEPKWAQPGEHSYPSTPICCSAKQSLHKASSFRIPD